MGGFAGYDMPFYYKDGVIKEHEWVRENAGLFDVSHMGQVILHGDNVIKGLESVTPSAYANMPSGRARYTVLMNDEGGIVDDLIVTKLADDRFFAVLNASRKEVDIAHITNLMPGAVTLDVLDNRALLALQGPKAEAALSDVLGIDASEQRFMWLTEYQLKDGTDIFVSRVGYTGEDGFELSVPNEKAPQIWDMLTADDRVRPAGLAARDGLRLEMGFPLYGHDIDETTSPVEAGLEWVIGKDRSGYPGAGRIEQELNDGVPRKRVGLKLLDRGIAREGTILYDDRDNEIGTMTSGGFSPVLKASIGMAYVDPDYLTPGTPVRAEVRGRKIKAEIAALPFLTPQTKSFKKPDKSKTGT